MRRARRGEGFVDTMLVVSVAAIAVVVAAYMWMPDFQRGARALVSRVADWVSPGDDH